MPHDKDYTVAWWCDRYEVQPFSVNVGNLEHLTEEERDIVSSIMNDFDPDAFQPSTSMSSRDLRASLRLVRRGVLFATFHTTPTIGERFFRRVVTNPPDSAPRAQKMEKKR